MKILSNVFHILILLSFFTPYFPIGCEKHAVETEEIIINQTDSLEDSVALEDTLSKLNNANILVDSSLNNTDTTERKLPFYAALLIQNDCITGFGALTVDIENDIKTIFSLRLCYILIIISFVFTFFGSKNTYKKIFILGVVALCCLLIVFIFNYKDLLFGFYLTTAICFTNTILSRYIWKKENK